MKDVLPPLLAIGRGGLEVVCSGNFNFSHMSFLRLSLFLILI